MADVRIRILGDASSAVGALNDVEKQAGGFRGRMKGILTGVGGVAAAAGVVQFGRSSVDAFMESEKSANQLQQAFQKFPALNDSNIASFQKLNEQLAKKTRFDDDATASGQAVLAQFGLTGAQIKQLTPLLQDYAAKTGTDLPTAAEQLGKAMLGKGRALQAIGVNFKDTGSVAGNFEQTVAGLRSQVGGFAESEGTTAAGKAEILKNQFGELQEEVGSKLVPALTWLAEKLIGIITFFAELSPGIQTAIGVGVGLLGVVFLITKAVQAWTAVQAALNFVMAMNPIALIVIAIAALVAGVIWAYNNVEWFRNGVQAVFGAIAGAAQWLGKVFGVIWDGIVRGFEWVRDTLKSIANWIAQNVINKFIDGINLLISAYNKVNIGGKDIGKLAHIPAFAEGGIVTKPTLGIIGEAGPEAVVPLSRGGGFGGGETHFHFHAPVGTERDIEEMVNAAMDRRLGRGGAVGGHGRYLATTG